MIFIFYFSDGDGSSQGSSVNRSGRIAAFEYGVSNGNGKPSTSGSDASRVYENKTTSETRVRIVLYRTRSYYGRNISVYPGLSWQFLLRIFWLLKVQAMTCELFIQDSRLFTSKIRYGMQISIHRNNSFSDLCEWTWPWKRENEIYVGAWVSYTRSGNSWWRSMLYLHLHLQLL